MKSKLLILFAVLGCFISVQAGIDHLLPRPQQIAAGSGSFGLNQAVKLTLPTISGEDPAVGVELTKLITTNGGSVAGGASQEIEVQLVASVPGAEFQNEAYNLIVSASKITVNAKTLQGAYWAVQTLWQLSEGSGSAIPACTITDWPAFRIRGYMHDIGRSFVQFSLLKKHIEKLSRYKINVFHWHLTDNQGWRLESQVYPQLNAAASYTRHAGQYYTIAQAQELVSFAKAHGVMIIPEIDMPGHSEAFRKAMGHVMLTNAGLDEMKNIMTEACATFAGTEWMHIGSDEVRAGDTQGAEMTDAQFVSQMSAHIRSKGKKIMVWRPGHGYQESDVDMVHMWSSSGSALGALPAVDSRYYYINHFDQYADVAGAYNSNIANQEKGSNQWAGIIVGIWNDRIMPNDDAIVSQNAFYASMLAIGERAWIGGGGAYLPQKGVMIGLNDTNFKDWERRFLYHKANFLQGEPIPYVKQTNVRWRITDAFPNGGNKSTVFPPETSLETSYSFNGATYNTKQAIGAGIYLRHVWGTLIPSFYASPQANATAYAYTWVYSPTVQTVGAQIEFQNYGRSEADLPPPAGKWDYNESKIWINDVEIAPPAWQNTHSSRDNEITLKNENFPARPLVQVQLNAGWNKVLIKIPNSGFSLSAIRLVKWMFTCVFVTPDGLNAVDGLIYSPDKNMNPSLETLIAAIDAANGMKGAASVGSEPGKYSASTVAVFQSQIDVALSIRNNPSLTETEYNAAAVALNAQAQQFKIAINYPKTSNGTKQYWYSFSAPLRDAAKFTAYQGDNAALIGQAFVAGDNKFLWKLMQNNDGTVSIVSKSANSYISKNSSYNTALKAQAGVPTSGGWTFKPVYTNAYFAITAGDVQFNQTGSGLSYQIYNWGNGNNLTDSGCQFLIRLEKVDGADAADSLQMVIDNAYARLTTTMQGAEPGYYSAENKTILNNAIVAAGMVGNNSASTMPELRAAKITLQSALDAYNGSINMPIASDATKTVWYSLQAVRENRAVSFQAAGSTLIGSTYVEGDEKQLWKLVKLNDDTFSLVNKVSGNYITTASPQLTSVAGNQSSGGWTFTPINVNNYFIIKSGTSQFNQGNAGTAYAINNWGSGTNTTDDGCRYVITTRSYVMTGLIDNNLAMEKIWIENGYLKTVGDVSGLSVCSVMGQQLNPLSRLPQGVVIVRSGQSAVKLFVR